MRQLSPRFGYYVVSFGTVLEFLGLVADSSSSNGSSRILSFHQPGDFLLVLGLAITVLGTILGFLSLSEELSHDVSRPPRLLPALPLVLLVGISIGSVAFAYQASGNSSTGGGSASAAASDGSSTSTTLVGATATPQCPPETFWLATTQQCLSLTADPNGNRAVATPVPAGATPVCPANTVWHPAGNHCLPTVCPPGFSFSFAEFACEFTASGTPPIGVAPTPACPDGTIWHPAGNHCLPTVCPKGYQFDFGLFECVQIANGSPTPVPTSTPTLLPGETPTPTPSISPTSTPVPTPSCPDGYFWHPVMGHCMSYTCPPGLVFNPDTLFCELPSTGTPVVTATVTPTPTTTPTATATPSPTPTVGSPTPVSTPLCPAGYFWHPVMGHCMSNTCPPGLVFNFDTLFCELPPTPSG